MFVTKATDINRRTGVLSLILKASGTRSGCVQSANDRRSVRQWQTFINAMDAMPTTYPIRSLDQRNRLTTSVRVVTQFDLLIEGTYGPRIYDSLRGRYWYDAVTNDGKDLSVTFTKR